MFDINSHILLLSNEQIDSVVKPALEFFETTPYYHLTSLPRFDGAGIYSLYLKSTQNTCYESNLPPMHPIYVGKAVPSGSRQGRRSEDGSTLRSRLQKHLGSIKQVANLNSDDFLCRFMIFQGQASTMISAVESYFIRKYNPLWNSQIDGFGINAPGAGRYNQSPSEWDTLHPGRYYAAQLTGAVRLLDPIMLKISNYNPPSILIK